ncbi:MAG: hypothetical protein HKO77_06870 [Gemmatimonadetes bacterium]|nr:hypothetical protein [Gemmatimonadota bacterium]
MPTVETARNGDPLDLARLLVSIPSVNPTLSPGGAGEARMAEVTADLLEGWGLDTETHQVAPGRWNVVSRLAERVRPCFSMATSTLWE